MGGHRCSWLVVAGRGSVALPLSRGDEALLDAAVLHFPMARTQGLVMSCKCLPVGLVSILPLGSNRSHITLFLQYSRFMHLSVGCAYQTAIRSRSRNDHVAASRLHWAQCFVRAVAGTCETAARDAMEVAWILSGWRSGHFQESGRRAAGDALFSPWPPLLAVDGMVWTSCGQASQHTHMHVASTQGATRQSRRLESAR
ncbi:hypothetical protein BKA66DRAFT_278298 [Pyrenochaeta sp. MPI-SDFR-AT-0127]|nr:hypothetical protein BKA66DRAFT_278298 [Pyrenochaeta sp. MPI-SDFR-AT-0127]